jgi:hypothetical protein
LSSACLGHHKGDKSTGNVDPFMYQDRSLDMLECRPLDQLAIRNAELEFVGWDAQGERYTEELPSPWA